MEQDALCGLKVVEYGQSIAGSYCTRLMADLGAEVIKVEAPARGDEARYHGPFLQDAPDIEKSGLFLYLNTNKLGITLNPGVESGRKLLEELLAQSDVFVENNPPRIMDELGLNYDAVKGVNPRLIVTSITLFGQTGPYRDYNGYAINAAALSGISYSIGDPEREPLTPPLSQGHYQSGAMGALATMGALFAREITGEGQHVDVAEADVWVCLHTGINVSSFLFHNRKRMRGGHRTPGAYPYTVLPCKDGHIFLIALSNDQWQRFVELMGNPDWTHDPRFSDQREMAKYADELDTLLAPWLMSHTKDEIFTLCREYHVPFAPVMDIAEVVNHRHFNEREYFKEIEHPRAGKLKYPGFPFRLSETPGRIRCHAPVLGQHNEAVLCERLGYSKEEFSQFMRDGIV